MEIRRKWPCWALNVVKNSMGKDQMLEDSELLDKVAHKSGSTSSYCPDFAQIPLDALISLAKRYELGEKKHGRDNWRKGLTDKSYVVERLNHVIRHAYTAIN